MQDDVCGGTDRSSCCQDVVHNDNRPAAQLVGCMGRKFEHAINIFQAFHVRQLCLKRSATGLEQKTTARIAVELHGECSACNVGEVTRVSLIPGAEPRNGDKNRSVSKWKGLCKLRQHSRKLSGQLILTLYLHLQYGLSQCSFIPVCGETRRRTGSEMGIAPSRVAWSKRRGTTGTDREVRFLAAEKTRPVSEHLAKNRENAHGFQRSRTAFRRAMRSVLVWPIR